MCSGHIRKSGSWQSLNGNLNHFCPGPVSKLILTKSKWANSPSPLTKSCQLKRMPGYYTTKVEATTLSQLRTGVSRLSGYLGKIKASPTLVCPCGHEEESLDHYLFRCPRWQYFREDISRCAGHSCGDTSLLLGGRSGQRKEWDL